MFVEVNIVAGDVCVEEASYGFQRLEKCPWCQRRDWGVEPVSLAIMTQRLADANITTYACPACRIKGRVECRRLDERGFFVG